MPKSIPPKIQTNFEDLNSSKQEKGRQLKDT